jgi:Uma2 family endonuclease
MEHDRPGLPTYRDFIEYVASRDGRFEYVDGFAVAMGTRSNEHQDISNILGSVLREHLRGSPCKVRTAAALWTGTRERSPDLLVTCDERDLAFGVRPNRHPKLVIEILSDNPGDDLRDKVDEYASIPSVEEYLVVDSTKRSVRRWHRAGDGTIAYNPSVISGTIRIESLGLILSVDDLYDEVGLR